MLHEDYMVNVLLFGLFGIIVAVIISWVFRDWL